MKGKFKSYDESTGKVLIEADTQVDSSSIDPTFSPSFYKFRYEAECAVDLSGSSKTRGEESYYLIVPEGHRRMFKITEGASVEFELVKEGSMEVKSIRF
ncbi:hypothetical protein [Pseudomonas sp. GM30]|uniref:hypothetical protein n=1 Tax=Pseudomonas sp. GM30 TaxID=1144328 RepID=UPI00026FF307|nr:hypothetical protein [Pseudomonas sp. GM30]EUB85762.1 hypothetical protein PMI25_005162 [Pseudomonas sp. GM30]